METVTSSVMSLVPSTKEEAEKFVLKLVEEVEGGVINPLLLHVKLNAMKKAMDDVTHKIAGMVLKEAEKYGSKKFDAYTAEITISEIATKYDYTSCGDPIYNEASSQENGWAEKRKEREIFLKTIKGSMDVIIEGEAITLNQPVKSSVTGIKVTLK
jgi:hypothetical protein